MDMDVQAAGGDDLAFARDGLGRGADDNVDAGLNIGIARLADAADAAIGDADVGLDHAPMVQD